MLKVFKAIDTVIEKFSIYGLVFSISVMLFLTILNIVLRWFDHSILWIDPFVRHLVFLSAFLGGTLATGKKHHIGIDILSKFLETVQNEKMLLYLGRVISLTSFLTLVWLSKAAIDLSISEFEFGKFSFLGIHSGFLISIIPFGLILICYRFFYIFVVSFSAEVSEEHKP